MAKARKKPIEKKSPQIIKYVNLISMEAALNVAFKKLFKGKWMGIALIKDFIKLQKKTTSAKKDWEEIHNALCETYGEKDKKTGIYTVDFDDTEQWDSYEAEVKNLNKEEIDFKMTKIVIKETQLKKAQVALDINDRVALEPFITFKEK